MNEQGLYTVLFEYEGGTYVSQVLIESSENVLQKWLDVFDFSCISKTTALKNKIKKEILLEDSPTLLKGMNNVWCESILIKKKVAFFYIILTQKGDT